MAADALPSYVARTYVARTSAAVVLITQGKRLLAFHEEGCQQPRAKIQVPVYTYIPWKQMSRTMVNLLFFSCRIGSPGHCYSNYHHKRRQICGESSQSCRGRQQFLGRHEDTKRNPYLWGTIWGGCFFHGCHRPNRMWHWDVYIRHLGI